MAVSEKSINDKIETTSILEEIKRESENDDLTFITKYSHKEDLENLLKLAEELDEKCSKAISNIRKVRILQVIAVIIPLIILNRNMFFLFTDLSLIEKLGVIAINLFIFLFSIFLFQTLFINDFKKQFSADKRALTEVLQLLRETSNSIAEQENWSVLSRAEFRIRLSRFDLGKYESKFYFFS